MFEIDIRKEDGYVNVTNLCKAGGKMFSGWNRLENCLLSQGITL